MIDVNSDTGTECLKLKEYPYNNALYSKNMPKWAVQFPVHCFRTQMWTNDFSKWEFRYNNTISFHYYILIASERNRWRLE